MSTTTADALRANITARIVKLTPTRHSAARFIAHRYELPLGIWAEKNPAGCLRRFSLTWDGPVRGPDVTNTDVEYVTRDMLVEVAYPTDWRHGGEQLAGLESAIAEDIRLIAHTVGTNGFGALATTTQAATVTSEAEMTDIAPNVSLGSVRLTCSYYRSNA